MLIADPSNNLQAIKEYILPKALPDLDKEELKQIITPMTAQNALQAPVVEETVRDTYTDPTVQQMAAEMETPSLEEAYGG